MRTRTTAAKAGKTLDARHTTPLAEGLAPKKVEGTIRDGFWCITLQGKEFRVPLDTKGKKGNRNWSVMSPEELLGFARAYCTENSITTRGELANGQKTTCKLYHILRQKKLDDIMLIDIVFPRKEFEEMVLDGRTFKIPLNAQNNRNWNAMVVNDILDYAKTFCNAHGITRPSELNATDPSLYITIKKRGLRELVFPRPTSKVILLAGETFNIPLDKKGKETNINWDVMDTTGLIRFVQAYCKHHDIVRPSVLGRKMHGLVIVLKKRGVFDAVISYMKQNKDAATLADLENALEQF